MLSNEVKSGINMLASPMLNWVLTLQKINVLAMKNSVAKTSKSITKFFSDRFSDGYLPVTKKGVAEI